MSPQELLKLLKPNEFESFVVVTNSGDRYTVRHSELAHLTDSGVLYIFEPIDDDGRVKSPLRIGFVNIAAIEPLPERAA